MALPDLWVCLRARRSNVYRRRLALAFLSVRGVFRFHPDRCSAGLSCFSRLCERHIVFGGRCHGRRRTGARADSAAFSTSQPMATLFATTGHAATLYIVTREKRRNNRLCGSGAWGNLCTLRSRGRDCDDEMGKHKEKNDTPRVAHQRHSPNTIRPRSGAGCSLANWATSVDAERFAFFVIVLLRLSFLG